MKEASDQVNKKYNRIKLTVQVIEIILTAAFFILLIFTNLSKTFRDCAFGASGNKYMSFLVFVFIIGGIEKIISLPLDFYSGFLLEHKFNLSNQSIFEWFKENVKATLLSLILVLPLLIAFYYFIVRFQNLWWVPTGIIFILFSLLLTKIAPVVIFPLFYKFENIENDDIREKLSDFAEKNGIKISGVFSFNLSKDTRKANAALAGLGNTKRILLADNLINNFTSGEILSVFAHEVGHYIQKHIIKLTIFGFFITFIGLYLVSYFYELLIPVLGYKNITDIAAFPLLALLFFIYFLFTMPLQNSISRKYEKDADIYAVNNSVKMDFISALNKLKEMNLADPEPHPAVEFIFYSHPSISKRINYLV